MSSSQTRKQTVSLTGSQMPHSHISHNNITNIPIIFKKSNIDTTAGNGFSSGNTGHAPSRNKTLYGNSFTANNL